MSIDSTNQDGRGKHPNSINNLKPFAPGECGRERAAGAEIVQRTRKVNPAKAFQDLDVNPFEIQAAILSGDIEKMKSVGIEFDVIYKVDKEGNPTDEILSYKKKGPISLEMMLDVTKIVMPFLASKKSPTKPAPPPKPPKGLETPPLPPNDSEDNEVIIDF